jgi:hypothetical protein
VFCVYPNGELLVSKKTLLIYTPVKGVFMKCYMDIVPLQKNITNPNKEKHVMSNTPAPTSPTPPTEPNKFLALMSSLAGAFSLGPLFEGLGDAFKEGVEITVPAITKTVDIAVNDDITMVATGHMAEIKAVVKSSTVVKGNASSSGGLFKRLFAPVTEKPEDTK